MTDNNSLKRRLRQLKKIEERRERLNGNNESAEEDYHENLLNTFHFLHDLFSRRGLLEGNVARANEIQQILNNRSSERGIEDSTGRKKRRRGVTKIAIPKNISSISSFDGSDVVDGMEGNLLRILSRILIPSTSCNVRSTPPSVIRAAAGVFTSICTHCSDNIPSVVATAEFLIISPIASHVLSGISRTIAMLLTERNNNIDEERRKNDPREECFKCATAIIACFGTRLSRSSDVIKSLQTAAESMVLRDHATSPELLETAAGLVAAIPLGGNSHGSTPTKLWTEMVRSTALELSITLNKFYPFPKKSTQERSRNANDINLEQKMNWINDMKNTMQVNRLKIFSMKVKGHTVILKHLLYLNEYYSNSNCNICSLPVTVLLEVIELMLVFSTIAESRYLQTEVELKNVCMDEGLLSPESAISVANLVKQHGYVLFQGFVLLLKNSSLQYSNRLLRITVSSLQSCSSSTLQILIDPSSSGLLNDKKWLNLSLCFRIMAVQSFASVVQSIGANVMGEPFVKGLTLVVGCLLEQIILPADSLTENGAHSKHWGTLEERSQLITICTNTLETCLTTSGGFMPFQLRDMIESTSLTCLKFVCDNKSSSKLFAYSSVKISFLRLGLSCVCTPWSDGGASVLGVMLKKTAYILKFDKDDAVTAKSCSTLLICNSNVTPRAPPLSISVTKSQTRSSIFLTHDRLIAGIHLAIEQVTKVEQSTQDRTSVTIENTIKNGATSREKIDTLEKSNELKEKERATKAQTAEDININEAILKENEDTLEKSKKSKRKPLAVEDTKSSEATLLANSKTIRKKVRTSIIDETNEIEVIAKERQEYESSLQLEGFDSKSVPLEEDSDSDFPPIIDCDPDHDLRE